MKDISKGFDILGNIAIVKFPEKTDSKQKKKFAEILLKKNKPIKTVLEKVGKFKGRLRKQQTKYILGEKTKEALYRENNCVFRLNVDKTYFSPRLSNERKEIASKIRKDDEVLVMFAGVSPYSIVIAKNSGANVVSVEINKEASKYAKQNVELNNLKGKVEVIQGDVKKVAGKLGRKFDVVVMPRPQLKDSFLKEAFMLSKKGTKVFYYDFCKEDEVQSLKDKIFIEAEKFNRRVKVLNVKKAGEVAAYRFRVRVEFIVA